MNSLIAFLIKEEPKPKFFLVSDPYSKKEIDAAIKAIGIETDTIDKIIYMGEGLPEAVYLKNMINKNGELTVSDNLLEDLMDSKVRKNRDMLLQQTDKDYLKAFSMDDKKTLKKISENKQFLRDLTKKPLIKNSNVVNLFFNISDLIIDDPGCGYDFPPRITISAPDSERVPEMLKMQIGCIGETAEAVCSIQDGRITSISMKKWGSGYFNSPSIKVEAPTSKGSRAARLSAVIINVLELKGI